MFFKWYVRLSKKTPVYRTEKDRIVGRISDYLNGLERNRYRLRSLFLPALFRSVWYRARLNAWFNRLEDHLPGTIREQARNLYSSDLFLLARAARWVCSRRKSSRLYLTAGRLRLKAEQEDLEKRNTCLRPGT